MFNIGSAVVLGLVLMGLINVAHTLVEGPNPSRIRVAVVAIVCFVTVQIVAASDFAHQQVLLNRSLDSLNFWSQMVIVVLLIGIASAAWQGIKAVSNIGQPMPKYPTAIPNGKQPLAGTGLSGLASTSGDLSKIQSLLDADGGNGGYPSGAPTEASVAAMAPPKPKRKAATKKPPAVAPPTV